MPAVLPPELYDESIDHLWDDPAALKACSLTCRAWVPSSRLHLFRTIRLQNAAHADSFQALLANAPVVARCVRRLTISADYKGVDQLGRAVEDDAWVSSVVSFVPKLQRVTTLGLSRLRWHALEPETQAALMELFKTVRTLFLFEVRFKASKDVLDFLCAFPVLDELYFHGVSWEVESPAPLEPADKDSLSSVIKREQERMQLSYLFLDVRSSPTLVTEWLLNHPSEQRLRTIQLCWREIENMKAVGDLLHASGASLERLLVEFPAGVPEEAVLENQISLVHNTGLRTVHFGGLTTDAAGSRAFFSTRLFPWVTALLSQIRSSHLQELTFEFEVAAVRDLLGLDWPRIDRDLSREEFKGLRVMFYVGCPDASTPVAKEVQALISDRLVGFREKGTLCVSCV